MDRLDAEPAILRALSRFCVYDPADADPFPLEKLPYLGRSRHKRERPLRADLAKPGCFLLPYVPSLYRPLFEFLKQIAHPVPSLVVIARPLLPDRLIE